MLDRLRLEITEQTMDRKVESAASNIQGLCAKGVQRAIDDFGVGYSSLTYVHQFPVDVLKIDRTLILDIQTLDQARLGTSLADAVEESGACADCRRRRIPGADQLPAPAGLRYGSGLSVQPALQLSACWIGETSRTCQQYLRQSKKATLSGLGHVGAKTETVGVSSRISRTLKTIAL